MLKVVVFDSGWGGELVADYIEEELAVVEVTRVIDWKNAPYSNKNKRQICALSEEALKPYLGKVDVIVLAGYVISTMSLEYLSKKYPKQKFVGMRLDVKRFLRHSDYHQIMVLASSTTFVSGWYQKVRMNLEKSGIKIIELEENHWIKLIDDGEMNSEILEHDLYSRLDNETEAIFLADTHFWDIKDDLEEDYKWRGRVLDERQFVLHDLCLELGFKGLDGKRAKY